MKLEVGQLHAGDVFVTLLTRRTGTVLMKRGIHKGIDVVLDAVNGDGNGVQRSIRPDVLVEVEK